jgi:phage shock protein E
MADHGKMLLLSLKKYPINKMKIKNVLWSLLLLTTLAFFLNACNPSNQNINFEESILVDVRTPEEFEQGSIENAINIPVDELPVRIGELKSDQQIVVFCRSGNRSSRAKEILEDNGFKKVNNGGGVGDLQTQIDNKKSNK